MSAEKLTPEQIIFRLGLFRSFLESRYDELRNVDEEHKTYCETKQDAFSTVIDEFDRQFGELA